jgi:hypothetical protein
MRISIVLAAVCFAALLANCGGGNVNAGGSCTYEVSGSVSATSACEVLVIANGQFTSLLIVPTTSAGAPEQGSEAQFVLGSGSSFEPIVYTQSTVQQSVISVEAGLTAVWDESTNATDQVNFPNQGSFTLTITSAGTATNFATADAPVTVWGHAHGSLDADLPVAPPPSTATGSVHVHVNFTDSVTTPAGFPVPVPVADAGTVDAGTPDSGTPDSGTPDSGTPDSGTPDSGTPDGGGVPVGDTACTETFTGAIQATVPCTVSVSTSGNHTGLVVDLDQNGTVTGPGASTFSTGGADLSYTGAFVTGTFTDTSGQPDLFSAAQGQTRDTTNWSEGFSANGSTETGTFTWTITSIGTPATPITGLTTYSGMHGSFTGTLTSAGQPNVNLSITF